MERLLPTEIWLLREFYWSGYGRQWAVMQPEHDFVTGRWSMDSSGKMSIEVKHRWLSRGCLGIGIQRVHEIKEWYSEDQINFVTVFG